MCGLFGVIATGEEGQTRGLRVPVSRAASALQLMQHRGPDCSRMSVFPVNAPPSTFDLTTRHTRNTHNDAQNTLPEININDANTPLAAILGHHRLSIIDRSEEAHQPMQRGPLWMVYNGEIYNYKELRQTLQQAGHDFCTQSDTEVLLALYAAHGPDMVHQLNGMFALAIWDTAQRMLFLARDRYGMKPLYYTRLQTGEFAFASEIKSLIALPGADKALDIHALSEHFTFQNMFQGRTLLKNVRLLEPGHWALLQADSGHLRQERYWEPVFQTGAYTHPAQTLSRAVNARDTTQAIHAVRETLERAIQRQLVGDVPIGSYLSGGLDTAAITAFTTQHLPHLHTFTAGFDMQGIATDETLFDERRAARAMAAQFGTQHHELTIASALLPSILPAVVWHLDDFRAGISYQNYAVSHMVKDSVTVVLSGVGGDELFAGYPWRYEPLLQFSENPGIASARGGAFAQSGALAEHYYRAWVRLLSESEKKALFTPEVLAGLGDFSTQDSFNEVFKTVQADHPLDRALSFDFRTFLPGLLIVEDRLSMAHSLESRVPFLDNDLVDLCLQLPWHHKLKPGDAHTPSTAKWILKEALKGILPDDVRTGRKQGFTPPDASWYRGPHRAYIESILFSPTALARGIFRPDALRALWQEHLDGHRNHRFLIWSFLCFEWWQRLLLDPPELTPPHAPA